MDRETVGRLTFRQLKELSEWGEEALAEKRSEAEEEYRERAANLAAEYGFKVAGKAGRPPKKKPVGKRKADTGNGHDDASGAPG